MQQQRQPCLAGIDAHRATGAFLLAVVDAKAAHAVGVFDDAHGRHHTFSIADEFSAFGNLHVAQSRREQRDGGATGQRRQWQRPQPASPWQQRQIAEVDSQQRCLCTEQREPHRAE